jgi:glutaredoxin
MNQGNAPRIAIYTTRACSHCRQAKQVMKKWGVRFQELDIENNHRAWAEFQRMKARGVPVITVGKRKLFGYDEKRLKKLLEEAGVALRT